MIEHYFQLQFRMLNRSIRDFGLHPAVAYIFAVLGFVVISYLLFYKVSFAEYIFPFFALASMYKLCNEDRNHWLAMNLVNHFRKIRFLENLIIALPFLIFMLVKASYFGIIILCLGMAILTFYTSKEINNVAIPTPFSSRPFEFLVGFRRTFIMFIIAYFLCGMAIYVDNYALGLFSVIVPFWISISFYNNQERIYLVWMNSSNAKIFLSEKLKTALLFSNLTAFLPAIAMLVYNPGQFYLVIIILLLGSLYIITAVLAKYSAFPEQMNVAAGFFFGIGFCLPPLLLFIIPLFYKRSLQSLQKILL